MPGINWIVQKFSINGMWGSPDIAQKKKERRQRSAGKAAAEEIGLLMDLRVVGSGATRRKGFPWAVGSFVEAAVNSKS